MKNSYTTHLICAPETEAEVWVKTLLVESGQKVQADELLVLLEGANETLEVSAPESGIVGDILVSNGALIVSGDLLLTMEIEEKPFGFLPFAAEGVEDDLPPACRVMPLPASTSPAAGQSLRVSSEAATLAARLALDLNEVAAGPDGMVDEDAVFDHVRDILIRWQKLKRLVVH